MTGNNESPADRAALKAAYSIVPKLIELIEETGEVYAKEIQDSAETKRFVYWRKLTSREHRRFKDTGHLPEGVDPEKDFRPSDNPRTPGMIRQVRKPLPIESREWERAKEAGLVDGQSPYPLYTHIDRHVAAAAIATILASEDIVREDVARVLTARATVTAPQLERRTVSGTDRRRLVAWLAGITRQGLDQFLYLRSTDDRAGRDDITRTQLLEREKKVLRARTKKAAKGSSVRSESLVDA